MLARWIPWVRTLAPIVAGMTRMNPRKYLTGTAIGAVIWVPVLVMGGYYGAGILDTMPWLKTTVTAIAIAFFVVGTGYGVWCYRGEMRKLRAKEAEEATEIADAQPSAQIGVTRPAPTIAVSPTVKAQG